MTLRKATFNTEKKLQEAILLEKSAGTPDPEIGRKYGVTYRYIEKIITRSKGVNVSDLKVTKKGRTLVPKNFKEEQCSVWSFRQRGRWATHSGKYRGNWSPYIPRNVILKYSRPGEMVLDYFCGAGTTAVEAKLLGRQCIAFDINDAAIELAEENIDFDIEQHLPADPDRETPAIYEPALNVGDARELSFLQDNSIDLICAHPPYADIIYYTDSRKGDLSFFAADNFLKEMSRVAKESFRVLKPGRQCAILIGDTRKKKHVVPLGFQLINVYLNAGFKLRELVIKRQHNCKTTGFWHANSIKYNFLLLAHEYLPVFEKPGEKVTPMKESESANDGPVFSAPENPPLKRKLQGLETKTVWLFPEDDLERCLNRNVVDRYSNGKGYSAITLDSPAGGEPGVAAGKESENKELLFIKSPLLSKKPSQEILENYLQQIEKIVDRELPRMEEGFAVIQTQDVRINGYIEPMAKRVVDMLSADRLLIKEIILVTSEKEKLQSREEQGYLNINHQYLLVYTVINNSR